MAETDKTKRTRLISGWDIKEMMDEEHPKDEEPGAEPLRKELAEKAWRNKSSERPILSEDARQEEVEAEARWVGVTITEILNTYAKQIRISARSKRWWSDTIKDLRKEVSTTKRQRKQGRAGKQAVEEARRALHRMINKE
jgi:hypothetical protein